MKTNSILLAALALTGLTAATLATGCSDEREVLGGQGTLAISASIGSDVRVVSRAATEQELSDKAIIWISNSKGAVRKYTGLNSVPAGGIRLTSGSYVAEGWTGDSVSASFDSKWFKGREEFQIRHDEVTRVELKCRIANTVVSVSYDEKAREMLHDYTFTVGHKRGELVFEGDDQRKGYFMMPSYDHNLAWTLRGTLSNGEAYERTGVIENVKPSTEYAVKIQYSGTGPTPGGGAYFDIVIDENEVVIEDEVVITLAPQFEGQDFDINQPVYADFGNVGRRVVYTYAVGRITSYVIGGEFLSPVIGGNDVDLFGMTEAVAEELRQAGINYTYSYNEEEESSVLKLNFEAELLNTFGEGENVITLSATDSNNKTNSASLVINTKADPIETRPADLGDVWATEATLTGTIIKSSVTNPGFVYRKQGDTEWIQVAGVVSGNTYSAKLTGLQSGTTYEYAASSDAVDAMSRAAGFISETIYTFTTEEEPQLPNNSFEFSSVGSDKATNFFAEGTEMFWDTGNHGSRKMNKDVTTLSTDKKHSGEYSIKLASQFVGVGALGKFAAGNVFAGEYLGTNGTNGILGWGRPWTSRPKALKGYVHYTPVAITSEADVPDVTLGKGDPDQGIIYIALLDGSITKEYDGKNYPVIVKTKEKEFFKKEDSNVIAYGELVLTDATQGDALVEFTIPLTYFRNNVKAVSVVVVASASRYGDYFMGGDGSTMYIDDLELVY